MSETPIPSAITVNENRNGFDYATTKWGDFTIVLVRKETCRLDDWFGYLVSKVTDPSGTVLWRYERGTAPAHYGVVQNEPVIYYTAQGKIVALTPVGDLNKKLVVGIRQGGKPLGEIALMKVTLAEILSLDAVLSDAERSYLDLLGSEEKRVLAEEQKAREAEAAAKREAEARAKMERRLNIIKRKEVVCYTECGERRRGVPVVGDEWMCLTDGTLCVQVESYDDGKVGKLIESFKVEKSPGKHANKLFPTPVTATRPAVGETGSETVAVETVSVVLNGKPEIVPFFASAAIVQQLHTKGLNGGTLVACPGDKAGTHRLFRIKKTGAVELAHASKS